MKSDRRNHSFPHKGGVCIKYSWFEILNEFIPILYALQWSLFRLSVFHSLSLFLHFSLPPSIFLLFEKLLRILIVQFHKCTIVRIELQSNRVTTIVVLFFFTSQKSSSHQQQEFSSFISSHFFVLFWFFSSSFSLFQFSFFRQFQFDCNVHDSYVHQFFYRGKKKRENNGWNEGGMEE